MKTIGVLTSGGDAPGMNAAIRAVVRSALHHGCKIYGINRGFQGLLDEDLFEMDLASVGAIIHKGGTILKSSRCEEFRTVEGRLKAVDILKKYQIDSLIVIGGDGSFNGAQKISELGFPAIGIPGTIDNDLAYTDYTIGFDTAMNIVIDSIGKIKDTCTSHEKASIVEVMGRHCGDLALYAGLAGGVEDIIVPEVDTKLDELCKKLKTATESGKGGSIIILAEGAGNAYELRDYIKEKTNISSRVTVLGFIQRGGQPTAFDRILASKLGVKAVELLLEGQSARVVGIKNNQVIDMDIHEALSTKKNFDIASYQIAGILSGTL